RRSRTRRDWGRRARRPRPRPRCKRATFCRADSARSKHMASNFSAPVSRDNYAIEHEPSAGSIRLSAEERDMARRSMPHLSADEAEKIYAAKVLKRDKMKSGLLK